MRFFFFLCFGSVQGFGWSVWTGTCRRNKVTLLRTTGTRREKWSVARRVHCFRRPRPTAAVAALVPRRPCTARRRHRPTGRQHPGTTSPSGSTHPMYKNNCKVPIFSGFVRFLFFYRQSLVCFFDDDVDSAWDSLVAGIPNNKPMGRRRNWGAGAREKGPRASTYTRHTPVGPPAPSICVVATPPPTLTNQQKGLESIFSSSVKPYPKLSFSLVQFQVALTNIIITKNFLN